MKLEITLREVYDHVMVIKKKQQILWFLCIWVQYDNAVQKILSQIT